MGLAVHRAQHCDAGGPPWKDESRLRRLYEHERMSVRELAEDLGTTYATIRKWMDEYEIERRAFDGSHQTPERLRDEAWLREQYCALGQSAAGIADEVGVERQTVNSWLDRHGIERTNPNDLSHRAKRILTHADRLRTLYIGEGLSCRSIAQIANCHKMTVSDWLGRHAIEARDFSFEAHGEEHYNWQGGHGPYDYGPTWNSQRKRALLRDDEQCRRCGLDRDGCLEKYDRDLSVHHIKKFRTFDGSGEANQLSNLITLCYHCHDRLEGLPIDNRQ